MCVCLCVIASCAQADGLCHAVYYTVWTPCLSGELEKMGVMWKGLSFQTIFSKGITPTTILQAYIAHVGTTPYIKCVVKRL